MMNVALRIMSEATREEASKQAEEQMKGVFHTGENKMAKRDKIIFEYQHS